MVPSTHTDCRRRSLPATYPAAISHRAAGDPLILPSLYSAVRAGFQDPISVCLGLGLREIHYDVMDGRFVPATGLALDALPAILARAAGLTADIHLMVDEPMEWIADAVASGARAVSFHPEATETPRAVIAHLRRSAVSVGIALSPDLSIAQALPLIDEADYALAMLIVPGLTGTPIRADLLAKLAALRAVRPDLRIVADGGVAPDTIAQVRAAGADAMVVGGALFAADPEHAYLALTRRAIG